MVCDDHYIMMLAALLKSIEVNHHTSEKIDAYIIDDHIKGSNKNKVLNSLTSKKIVPHFIPIEEVITKKSSLPGDSSFFPFNIYARIFISEWLPKTIRKILYLDVDMIFRRDISELWGIKINGATIAAVLDKSQFFSNSWAGIPNYKELNFAPETKYFNSGLLIIDTEKWRLENIKVKVLACIQDNLKFATYPDQYGLNIVFANKWFNIDERWNTQSGSTDENPYVIHFTGRKPIYRSYQKSQDYNKVYRDEFYKYLRLTQWSEFESINEYQRLLKKLYIKLRKNKLFARF